MIIVADPSQGFHQQLTERLGSPNGLASARRLLDVEQLLEERGEAVDAVVFGPNFEPREALETAERVQVRAPGLGMVLIAPTLDPELLRAALRSGMRDVLSREFSAEELEQALRRARDASRHVRGAPSEGRAGTHHRVVTVFSTKGGCGKSIVASNLAVLLAERTDEQVALVDLDLQSGDLSIMFQLLPAWTIHDAAGNLDRLDTDALRGYLTSHRSGVQLLAAPVEPSQAEHVTPGAVHRILRLLRDEFRYTIVDGPAMFTDEVLAALDESDECVLVASMDVPSIKNLKLALQTLEQLGLQRERIRVVLNRADSNVGLSIRDVEKALQTKVDVSLPSSRDVPVSVNHGVPLAIEKPRSHVVSAIGEMIDAMVRTNPGQSPPAAPWHA